MGYECVRPTGPGTYPSIEKSRPLRWSAFEECGVRQVRGNNNKNANNDPRASKFLATKPCCTAI